MNRRIYLLMVVLQVALSLYAHVSMQGDVSSQTTDIKIIAHRGDSFLTPENTMAAVNSAWDKDVDAVEVDVYLSRDNRVMVIHDATTGRTGDRDYEVRETTADKLREVDVGSFKELKFKGEKIPFLEEVITSVPPGKELFIEIKGTDEAVPFIREIIEGSGKKDQVVIIGFNLNTVAESKKIMPEIPVFWLHSAAEDDEGNTLPIPLNIIETAEKHNLNGVNINYKGITKEFVETCRKADQQVYVWTVDAKSDIKAVLKLGVDGITTNRIDNARQVLAR